MISVYFSVSMQILQTMQLPFSSACPLYSMILAYYDSNIQFLVIKSNIYDDLARTVSNIKLHVT